MNDTSTLDVDEKVVVLKEIRPQHGNRYWSKPEIPRIYLGVEATGET